MEASHCEPSLADRLIACWLSQYCEDIFGERLIPPDPDYIRDAIRLLISEGVMTTEDIRREAVIDFGVIIPCEYFPEEDL